MTRDHNKNCDRAQEAMLDQLLAAASSSADGPNLLQAHLRECADCRARLGQWKAQAAALAKLPRRGTPVDLEGRVVAALNAGYREERAVQSVSTLSRLKVPLRLAGELESFEREEPSLSGEPRAPQTSVDGLGSDEVGFEGLVLEGMGRRAAPDELRRRLELEFAGDLAGARRSSESAADSSDRPGLTRPPGVFARSGLAAGLLGFAAVVLLLVQQRGPSERSNLQELAIGDPSTSLATTIPLSFTVRRIESLRDAELDPSTAALLSALTGGLITDR